MSASAPASEASGESAPRAGKSPLASFLVTHPFSMLLSLVIIGTGLGFGTFWGRFPQELAAGTVTTAQLGYWWTPFSALLVPDSLIDGLLTAALALTVMAYAERLLGLWKTVIVFLVTGALGMLIGVGVELAAAAMGEMWGSLASLEFVLDPSTGVVGVILCGSAFAPALFRRRIRVIGFSALLMFALYAGDSDSVYRLIAALAGFAAGLILARGRSAKPWHRSSYREARTLIAAIVAVAGLGPLIVILSGISNGPLSLTVTGFAQLDADEVYSRCADSVAPQCAADLDHVLTSGPGPFLLSLLPLVLSVIAAGGLRLGRRAAWILAICVNVAMVVLTATSLGALQLIDPSVRAAADPEIAGWILAATLVPLTVVVLLIVTRRRFTVSAPRAAVRRFMLTTVVAFVGLALLSAVTLLVSKDALLLPAEPPAILLDTLLRFVPGGFVSGLATDVVPAGGFPLVIYQWVGVVFWVVFIVALILLYRTTATGQSTVESERYRALLKRGGGGTLGFMGTWPGNEYWFTPDGDGAVAYRVISGVALTMSDPVCAAGADASTIKGFVDFCDSQGWHAVFYSFHDRYLPVFDSLGWQHMSVGEETVLSLPGLEMAGKPWQKIRQALNKGTREGITTLWSTWDDLPASIAAQIDAISEEWVAEKELPEMGFTLGGMDELKDPEVLLYLALDAEGGVQAITSWLPSWSDDRVTGWTIDFMRRGDDSMPGIMEFVIASAALHMKELGAEVMSLSGAPLATKPVAGDVPVAEPTVMDRLLGWLGSVLEPAYGFTSLFRFKSKFNPTYETIHMAYADPAALPTIGMAIGRAYLPDVSAREYLALAKTLTGGSKRSD